jgi:hypothetical protein
MVDENWSQPESKLLKWRLIQWAKNQHSIRYNAVHLKVSKRKTHNSYLSTYDLYGPVRNSFDAASIYFKGKWEGVGLS